MMSLLYIIGFYGSPPLNFWEKYLRENKLADLTIVKVPFVRLDKGKFAYEADIKKSDSKEFRFNLNLKLDLPSSIIYVMQYILNVYAFIYLLTKVRKFKYDFVMAEASFGGALAYVFRILGFARYSIFMNGDIIPKVNTKMTFYMSKNNRLNRLVDVMFIKLQGLLRKIGNKCDLVWYPNELTAQWDIDNGYEANNVLVLPTVLVDKMETIEAVQYKRQNANKTVLGYIGRLDELAGVDMALKMLVPLSKLQPDVLVKFIGGGSRSVEKYRKMVKYLGIEKNVKFYGFIKEHKDAFNLLSDASLGLALYRPDDSNVSMYAEPGKPKDYVRMGMPVIITVGGPVVGKLIDELGAGVLVDYNEEKIAEAINDVINDRKKYLRLLNGVEKFGAELDYSKYFPKLYELMVNVSQNFKSN